MDKSNIFEELNSKVREKASEFIRNIEINNKVSILYAVETGSRGYGLQVKNSDFDIKVRIFNTLNKINLRVTIWLIQNSILM